MKYRNYYSLVKHYISSRDWWLGFGKNLLASYGAIWLVAEPVSFFSDNAELFLSTKGTWYYILGFLVACFLSRPRTVISSQLKDRDITIEIRIANAFDVPGDLVIPTNTTFDTDFDGRIPKANSIQGEFTRRYYDSEIHHLDLDIDRALSKEDYQYEELPKRNRGKKRQYPIGTVIQLQRRNRLFYLVANSHIKENGVANTTMENLSKSLEGLWCYISEKGFKSDIVIPLMGTGKGRLGEKREDIFLEIIRSFIASCSSSTYCDKVIIAIYPPDVTTYGIDLHYLKTLLGYSCKYARFES